MIKIQNREQLQEFAREHGLRDDWHEPDEQEVDTRTFGNTFDNAMGPGHMLLISERSGEPYIEGNPHRMERQVVLMVEGQAKAVVNLATLFALACGPKEFGGIDTAPEDPLHVQQVLDHIAHLTDVQEDAIREALNLWAQRGCLTDAGFERDKEARFDLWKHPKTGQRMGTRMALAMLDGERCYAVLHHGPGHQSTTNCDLTGEHEFHQAEVHGQIARWRGDVSSSGFFDEMPQLDEED